MEYISIHHITVLSIQFTIEYTRIQHIEDRIGNFIETNIFYRSNNSKDK